MHKLNRMALLAVTALVALAACDDSGDPLTPDGDDRSFAIVMQPEASAGAALLAPSDPSAATLSLDVVESIVLPIGAVEALAAGDGGWIHAGSIDASVDLLALPAAGVTLLDSSLPQGEYTALRFLLTDVATVTLSEDVTVGRTLYEAGTHPLVIPSSEQNGVRLRAAFQVDEDGQLLTVLFDGDATLRQVTATGSGTLKIAPELRVQNEEGEDVGELDDDETDEENEVEAEGFVASVTETGIVLEDGTVVTIQDDTEIRGDLLSLTAVAEALVNGETVVVEAEGSLAEDGTTIIASEVDFDVEEADEIEVEGIITAVDRSAGTFAIDADGQTITVVLTEATVIDNGGDFDTFEAMADAFDADRVIWAEAEGSWEADNRLAADEVEFETDDSV